MQLLDFEPVTPFSEPSNCECVMLYSLTGVGFPDRMGSTDIEERVWGKMARAAGEWMCPSADCCVYSSVLPESVKMDFSSWAWLWPGDESTLQLDFRFSRHDPSKLCLRGPPGLGACYGLWVLLGLVHTCWCGLRMPASPGTGPRESPLWGGGHPQWLWASGSRPLDAEHRRAQQTRCPVAAGQAPAASALPGGGWPFRACLYWWSLDEANFVGFVKTKVRICL